MWTGTLVITANVMPLVDEFENGQARSLARFGVQAESRYVDTPVTGGRAHLLVAGAGPPLMMAIGGTIPAAFWAAADGRTCAGTRSTPWTCRASD